ncbi:hypothetical protein AC1031_004116 [Aphanomyces cochlioides]|nr:hypothetical protein AC1031_004116 [Aphanomyces cochlioides]
MTVALTVRADGTKLPIMLVTRGQPRGRIESHELPTYPEGHVYAVQQRAWMDSRVWPMYLREVLGGVIAEHPWFSLTTLMRMSAKKATEWWTKCSPLDVGIMALFKNHLRNLWLEETLVEDEENEDDEDNLTARTKRLVMIKRAIEA